MKKTFYLFLILMAFNIIPSVGQLRIIGGNPGNITEVPSQIYLKVRGVFKGSGCIVGDRWVLVATHCVNGVYPSDIEIVYGITCKDEITAGNTIGVAQFIKHPTADIALLRLKKAIPLSSSVPQKISIANNNTSFTPGTICKISGWGYSYIFPTPAETENCLQTVNLRIVDDQKANSQFPNFYNPNYHIVTEGMDPMQTTAQGDSGSPLVTNGTLIGIVHAGTKNNSGTYTNPEYTIYTKVSAFHDWITSTMEQPMTTVICMVNGTTSPFGPIVSYGGRITFPYNSSYQSMIIQVSRNGGGTCLWEMLSNNGGITWSGYPQSCLLEGIRFNNGSCNAVFKFRFTKSAYDVFEQEIEIGGNAFILKSAYMPSFEQDAQSIIVTNQEVNNEASTSFDADLKSSYAETQALKVSGLDYRYEIYDIYKASLVRTGQFMLPEGNTERIDISSLTSGLYVINVYQGNEKIYSEKIMVK